MVLSGIADPLRQLPDMHAILDVTETVIWEGKANEGGDALQKWMYEVYKPEPEKMAEEFDPEDQLASFDAAFEALGGLR